MTPRERGYSGQRPQATLNYNCTVLYCAYNSNRKPKPQQDPRDTKGTGGHAGGLRETPEGPEDTRDKGDARDTRRTGDRRESTGGAGENKSWYR
jgi:hypothetical protein